MPSIFYTFITNFFTFIYNFLKRIFFNSLSKVLAFNSVANLSVIVLVTIGNNLFPLGCACSTLSMISFVVSSKLMAVVLEICLRPTAKGFFSVANLTPYIWIRFLVVQSRSNVTFFSSLNTSAICCLETCLAS